MLRQTKEGWWIIDGDTHLSKWVEESGRIDHDEFLVPQLRLLIKPGSTVIDIGANIGTHTVAYAETVGYEGNIIAFEPNPEAREALLKNMEKGARCAWAAFPYGLSDKDGNAYLKLDPNAGASHIPIGGLSGEDRAETIVLRTLDGMLESLGMKSGEVSYIKIDAEGFELKILQGAKDTLHFHRPIILLEVNTHRLRENGTNVFEILSFLTKTLGNYQHRLIPATADYRDPQYDLLVLPLPNPPAAS